MAAKNSKNAAKARDSEEACRLDIWLWAARWVKTRQQASEAIRAGKVRYNGQRVKAAKQVTVGAELRIRQTLSERVIMVAALSRQRLPARAAVLLYTETEQSILEAVQQRALHRVQRAAEPDYGGRPDKRARRHIHRFKQRTDKDEQV